MAFLCQDHRCGLRSDRNRASIQLSELGANRFANGRSFEFAGSEALMFWWEQGKDLSLCCTLDQWHAKLPSDTVVFIMGRSKKHSLSLLVFSRVLVLVGVIWVLPGVCLASASNIYIAPSAVGSGNGADCGDALSFSFFNSSANWGSGSTQIGPGTSVHLCAGTYSFPGGTSCGLSFQGNGNSSGPITLLADQGAVTITAPYWGGSANGGGICSSGYSYVTVNGENNLTIQATANGSSFANQADYGFGVWALYGNNVTIENLTVSNIYVHTQCVSPYAGCDEGGQNTGGIAAQGSNVTISGDTIHDAKWCITGGVPGSATIADRVIINNTIYDCDHGVAVGVGNVNGVLNGLVVAGNDMYSFNVWDDNPSVNNNHHDGIHIWSYDSGDSITGAMVYDNYIHGDWGASWNSAMFTEASGGVPSAFYFNNVLVDQSSESHQGCGVFCQEENGVSVLNNTIVSSGAAGGGSVALQFYGSGVVVENNTISGAYGALLFTSGATYTTVDYNNYYNIGANGFNNGGSFSSWQSSCACDGSSNSANPGLSGTYAPTSGSTALSAGVNLDALSISLLDVDKSGVTRPPLPAGWTIGAYQYESNSGVAAPTNLSAVAH